MVSLKKYFSVCLTVLLVCGTVYAFNDLAAGSNGRYDSIKSDEEILSSVYYGKIASVNQMEKLWIKFVKERY